ncbi:MAG: hypothetical protein A2725_02090 [Candidatus Magasanikbacteria bacterium RIFCSPHIGHO2_01_FULL_33_34]|uniref:UPF0102 protein A2725_02090 n=1 Tax=Candidatus Magasanikbacteria bacterium RIFCSPHIGHO2_01_FULL_33_34 TaxID=1798671 RepID=A0A1F6LKD1_9BACT|nr:MAG: hypothetical protein A2725_02090 [Candidatus Magasanikbacteria bacterium RIFCSPHIGHO2_01_FULL_33_34]OGH65558.1 MAG: hypothetical protein A3B83_01665 [Candidatus Magasanikbacteria bacterium RIFCSPHIGHO2_02_FULL_33_17]OGH76268.1 MAG: hypothetical protein A3A89_02485 [Candidatus Magasanikbacteria bacterium RIFCSPLOWO2_01_FULL_33_34]OGH81119.1 MAG: hypothetical protein A3F93_00150 [Candidatus Magasanikbacteria bacterium RIFCSPLOWO2_12_FULL_34_7]
MAKTEKRKIGDFGEDLASSFLIEKSYNIIERNFLCREGEIDIIAWYKIKKIKTLCFVEVKTRKQDDGSAERATNQAKLNRLFKAARRYCIVNNINVEKTPIQFEQVSVFTSDNTFAHYIIPIY